ncbi:MAG: response regulator [Anaerolineales bacterium]|nr:MAG: response regulator [Anaerolineales bacterium]
MENKPVVLLVEDDPDSASDYKEDIEALIDVTVITVSPPVDLLDLAALINGHNASAVILDERLQQRSDATYVGIDAFDYLRGAFPRLPVDILTNYPHSPELKGRGLHAENLVRKREFDDDADFRESYLRGLYQRIRRYRQRQDERHKLIAASDTVTEEFVESLAQLHFEADDEIEQIIWVRSGEEKQIRLIEVNRTALPSESIQAFRFAPSKDVPFPIFIADVRPTEWERIQSRDIPLPEGWSLEEARVFHRSEVLPEGREDVG